MKKFLAEMFGTMFPVLMSCGSYVLDLEDKDGAHNAFICFIGHSIGREAAPRIAASASLRVEHKNLTLFL